MTHKTHPIVWISLVFLILTFLFFIASVFVLEFAVTADSDGDILIPWYYWLFFVGSGIFLVVFVILQAIPVHYKDDNIIHEMVSEDKREDKREEEIVIQSKPPTYGDPLLELLRR